MGRSASRLPFSFAALNPVLLAEQVGTLAAFAEGRFILQCGIASQEDAEPVFNRVTAGGYRGFSSASLIWGSVSSVAEQFAALGA